MELWIVDVFAERRFAGNQLAVVRGAEALSTEVMQDVAREMNFSETAFVIREAARRARVRIFTPQSELPFAGHPTIGTAWVLAQGEGVFTLELDAGDVAVAFEDGVGWMTPPPVTLGDRLEPAVAAQLAGLGTDRLDGAFPPRLARVGPSFVLVGVRDRAALASAKLDSALHGRLLAEGLGVQCVFLFTRDAHSQGADFAARMFFDAGGVREDPATGSANTAFAAYLAELGDTRSRILVEQGVEMGRPSRLYLELGGPLRVGGRVQPVARGELLDL